MKELLCLIILLLITGCDYFKEKDGSSDVVEVNIESTCEVQAEKFEQILEADISSELICVQNSFTDVAKITKTANSGSITIEEMRRIVNKQFPDSKEKFNRNILTIFEVSALFLGNLKDQLPFNSIQPLFNLLIEANKAIAQIRDSLDALDQNDEQQNFWYHRYVIEKSLKDLRDRTLKIIIKNSNGNSTLNLKEFILDLNDRLEDVSVSEDEINSLLFINKLFVKDYNKNLLAVENENENINTLQLLKFIKKIPTLFMAGFDLTYTNTTHFEKDRSRYYLMRESVKTVFASFSNRIDNEDIVNVGQIMSAIELFLNATEVKKYSPTVEKIKERILGGKPSVFTFSEVKELGKIVQAFFDKIYFADVTYFAHKDELDQNKQIDELPFIELDQYRSFTAEQVQAYFQEFNHIIKYFKFYRDKWYGMQYYSPQFIRPRYGVVEMMAIRYIAEIGIEAYDTINIVENKSIIDIPEIDTAFQEFRPVLEELGLWSPYIQTFGRNTILFANFFQYQSNGDSGMGIDEGAEYISLVFTALESAQRIMDRLEEDSCDPGTDPDNREFDVLCYRENFFDIVFNDLNYRKYIPKLYEYLSTLDHDEKVEFLATIESFARDDDSITTPMRKRDFGLVIGAFLNIESTFVRFDTNQDNVLTYEEVEDAFLVYREAVISLGDLNEDDDKIAKSAFYYMVKKMKDPAGFGVFLFHFFGRKQNIEAKRLNIGTLIDTLVRIANENA